MAEKTRVTTYSPKNIRMEVGKQTVQGFSEDSFVSIELQGDGTSFAVGADGEVVRAISASEVYTVKIKLLQGSATNDYLQKLYDMDRADDTMGKGIVGLSITDPLGNEKFTGGSCWIAKPASWARGKEQTDREWELTVADGKFGDA